MDESQVEFTTMFQNEIETKLLDILLNIPVNQMNRVSSLAIGIASDPKLMKALQTLAQELETKTAQNNPKLNPTKPIMGQEVVTPKGLGRIVKPGFRDEEYFVRLYAENNTVWFSLKNLKLIPIFKEN
jgi:hypothetical protein